MYKAFQIANFFIEKAKAEGCELTPMKLIKLVYIAHGWSLAILDKPLVNEDVQAWQYGPVFESLYHQLKKFGKEQVSQTIGTYLTVRWVKALDNEALNLLEAVWNAYKHLDGLQLSTITHQKDTPWYIVHESKGTRVPNTLIQEHYRQLMNKQQSTDSR